MLAESGRQLVGGTAVNPQGQLVSAGGRVLSVTAIGDQLAQARERAYGAIALITLAGSHFRTDIAEIASASK